jgi:hypothetical protein
LASNKGSSKTPQALFGGSPEKKPLFPVVCRFFPSIFLSHFLAVSVHEEPKNTIKNAFENQTRKPQKISKKYRGTYLVF